MRYFILIIIFFVQSCLGFSQSLVGTWSGELKFGQQQLKFVIHLDDKNGDLIAKGDSPDQGAYGIPFDVSLKKDSLFLKNKQGIELKLRVNSNSLEGDFYQNGYTFPLKLERSITESRKISRPQTPQQPYPYDTLDVDFKNDYDNIKLSGTLTFPKDKKRKYPAVILISGSGPQDRNSEVFHHKIFKVLADRLTRQGIVVLRYDDRGVGKSEGVFETSTIENFSKDAIAAFNFLKKQSFIDTKRVGIVGHSEGGLIAQLLAGQNLPNLSFIVSLAGPSFSMDKMMAEQLYAIGKSNGMTEDALLKARKVNMRNFEILKSDLSTEEAYQAVLENMSAIIPGELSNAQKKEIMTMLGAGYRYFIRIEPEKYISKIKIPVFAAFGTLDLQVPSTLNLKSLHDLLPINKKTVLKEYEKLNHLFQPAKTGMVNEYGQIETTMDNRLLEDIALWIKSL